jgi:uncharacterized phage protein (TIGR01671 family)
MQDRFKFKAYIKHDDSLNGIYYLESFTINQYVTTNGYVSTYEYFINISTECGIYCPFIPLEDIILMRCIGLKDSTGKLIYEGDILKFSEYDNILYTSKTAWFNREYILVFESLCGRARLNASMCKELNIIGNIHENKGLKN